MRTFNLHDVMNAWTEQATVPEAATLPTPPLNYSTLSYSELRAFAIARTADPTTHKKTESFKKTTKDKLARLLRRLDANPKFSRFFDLPPVLREQIYGLFLANFGGRVEKTQFVRRLRLVSEEFCDDVVAMLDKPGLGARAEIESIGHGSDVSDLKKFMGPLYQEGSCDDEVELFDFTSLERTNERARADAHVLLH